MYLKAWIIDSFLNMELLRGNQNLLQSGLSRMIFHI